MQYNKPAISFSDQLKQLSNRGLIISNLTEAEHYLANISYYRLRAYTFPFQDNNDPNHPFVKSNIIFNQIIDLYNFDRKLRLLVFDAIEKIEIAFRTQIIYHWSIAHGSHWYTDPSLFRDSAKHTKHLHNLTEEIKRSTETFIDHYYKTYTSPTEPPAWMTLEISSVGLLSQLFQNLKKGIEKKAVTSHFGLNKVDLFENWIHSISNIRNICAHHGRLWNRKLTFHIDLPTNPVHPFIANTILRPYKLYPALCAMAYLIEIINPQSTFKIQIRKLILSSPLNQAREMGFPKDWEKEIFWQ